MSEPREIVERAMKALEPFAQKARDTGLVHPRFENIMGLTDKFTFKRNDLRRAEQAYNELAALGAEGMAIVKQERLAELIEAEEELKDILVWQID